MLFITSKNVEGVWVVCMRSRVWSSAPLMLCKIVCADSGGVKILLFELILCYVCDGLVLWLMMILIYVSTDLSAFEPGWTC
jgi:hypothetical protein